LQRLLQPSKERTTTHSKEKFENRFSKNLPSKKKLPILADLQTVTYNSVNLKSKILLRQQILGISKKNMNPSKMTLNQNTLLEQQ
jgi:hypothetical protein